MHEGAHQWECLVQYNPENTLVREIQKHYSSHFTVQEKTEAEKMTFPRTKQNTKQKLVVCMFLDYPVHYFNWHLSLV